MLRFHGPGPNREIHGLNGLVRGLAHTGLLPVLTVREEVRGYSGLDHAGGPHENFFFKII